MKRRIAIVGAGAIGGYYGAKLARAGGDVHFLLRSDLETVARDGIRVRERTEEEFTIQPVNCYGITADIGPCDLVLVALKATANNALPKLLAPLLDERTILLTFQNGLGNEEFLAKHFGASRVIGGLCFVCLNRTAAGLIEHYDVGRIALGEFEGGVQRRTAEIAQQFVAAGVNCTVVDNLQLERWRKLVWNIPFNGLAVSAGGITTDRILRDARLREYALQLMHETIDAANRCGFALAPGEADVQMERTGPLGAYRPSTLIDFEAGRPLEVEAIWGEPLRRAAAAGADTPRLRGLYADLQKINRRLGCS